MGIKLNRHEKQRAIDNTEVMRPINWTIPEQPSTRLSTEAVYKKNYNVTNATNGPDYREESSERNCEYDKKSI